MDFEVTTKTATEQETQTFEQFYDATNYILRAIAQWDMDNHLPLQIEVRKVRGKAPVLGVVATDGTSVGEKLY